MTSFSFRFFDVFTFEILVMHANSQMYCKYVVRRLPKYHRGRLIVVLLTAASNIQLAYANHTSSISGPFKQWS